MTLPEAPPQPTASAVTAAARPSARRPAPGRRPLGGRAAGVAGGLLAALALTSCAGPGASGGARPSATPSASADATAPAGPSASASAAEGALRDGEYTAKGWYGGGPSSIDVTVRLESGDVAEVEVRPNATNETSLDYQRRFASGVGELVVGRPLRELGDVVVSGSSSTAGGYDDAVRKIAEQAAVTP